MGVKITNGRLKNKIVFTLLFTLLFTFLGIDSLPNIAKAASIPKITGVQLVDKNPTTATYPTLKLTSKGSKSVQYSVYLYSKTKKVWENVSGGYTKAVAGNSTYTLKLTTALQQGDNSFSIWVKNAGTPPTNKGGYDDFKSYKITASSTSSQKLPTIKSADIDSAEQKIGINPSLKLTSNGDGKVQYRVYKYLADKKSWVDVSGGYTAPINASSTASLKLSEPMHEGQNSFSIWVKRAGQNPSNKEGYDNFLSYRVHVGATPNEPDVPGKPETPETPDEEKPETPEIPGEEDKVPPTNVIPEITSSNIDSKEVVLGNNPTITLKSSGDKKVQYSVYMYSKCKNVWEDVSGGYTKAVDPNTPYSLKITKPLQLGTNTFSIWVKRDGIAPVDKGGYDSFVHESVNVSTSSGKIAKISSALPNSGKIAVGTKPEISLIGASGDDSNISYKAFLYSNSQRQWIDALSYTSPVSSGTFTTLSLNTPLESGTNKILIWAKRSSITGDVYEDYKIVEIDAIRPGPVKQKIVIDPGHGGKDSGATNKLTGSLEKNIALSVSLKLGDILKSNGYDILYTRTDNNNVAWDSSNKNASLKYRYDFANSNGADLFVSIHCNASNGAGYGAEVLYSKQNPNKDKAFATAILNEYIKATGMKSRGIKNNGNWQVVNNTKMPASLVELGFIDNASDEPKLKDPVFQEKAANGIANGINTYLGR